jgi:hypothetical protein
MALFTTFRRRGIARGISPEHKNKMVKKTTIFYPDFAISQ